MRHIPGLAAARILPYNREPASCESNGVGARKAALAEELPMRSMLIPAAVLALLAFCSPGRDRQNQETGMGGAAASGGDATPTPVAILSELNVANVTEIQLAGLAPARARGAPGRSRTWRDMWPRSGGHSSRSAFDQYAVEELEVTMEAGHGTSYRSGGTLAPGDARHPLPRSSGRSAGPGQGNVKARASFAARLSRLMACSRRSADERSDTTSQ
jgi:hypothetical protein